MAVVGFVGLGVMGGPMAGHLVAKGFKTIVWNRTLAKCLPLAQAGAAVAPDLQALAAQCDIVCVCVSRTEDVEQVLASLLPTLKPGAIVVDHSTIEPSAAERLQMECKSRQVGFLDAPVTGGSMGAQNGTLTIFCGGEPATFAAAHPIMSAYAKRAELVGGPGRGQMMKMANQIAVGGALLGLCECLAFAQRAGLDMAQTKELVGAGAAGSWAFENYGPKILAGDWSPGFSVDNQRKDFGYVVSAAGQIDANVPMTVLADELLARLTESGRGGETTAALFEVLLGDKH